MTIFLKHKVSNVICSKKVGRLLAIDYGAKRTGIAVTDTLQLIASGLTTVSTQDLRSFLKEYISKEEIDCIVIGQATRKNGDLSMIEDQIIPFIKYLKKQYPSISIEREDEGFTSQIAFQSMIDGGLKKKKRQDKALVDKISATLILQRFMERH